jgi:hypothetical protein
MEVLTGHPHHQALFEYKDQKILHHQGLKFRSATEVRVYDELIKRRLLVFPLPVAVLGDVGTYREPDFLVFTRNGRSGILEIHGTPFHSAETAAQEHDRRRRFVDFGVNEYEIYDAAQCYNATDRIVSDFLIGLKGVDRTRREWSTNF